MKRMIRKTLSINLMVFILLVLLAAPILAVSVSDAKYVADIAVKNDGSADTDTAAVVPINTQALIGQGFAASDLKNTALQSPSGTDLPYMPSVNATYPWAFWLPSIGASGQFCDRLYMGGDPMQDNLWYFPDTGGMTTPDSASLELGDNFTMEQKGWVDATYSVDKYLVNKPDALTTFVSDTQTITSNMYSTTDWVDVQTGVFSTGWQEKTYTEGLVSQARVKFRNHNGSTNLWVRVHEVQFWDSENGVWVIPDDASGNGWTNPTNACDNNTGTYAEDTVPYGDQWSDWLIVTLSSAITSNKIKYYVSREHSTLDQINLDVYRQFLLASVTATGVSSGEHTVKTSANLTSLGIWIDGELKDSTALTDNVTDNSEDWTFVQNNVMPYMEYQKIWVDGVLKQHIIYERDTVFSDLSGYSNDATPTFRTESQNPDISATFANLRPIKENELTGWAGEEAGQILTTPPEAPGEMYTEMETEHLPGAALVNELLEAGGIPKSLFWLPFCFGMAALASLVAYKWVKSLLIISGGAGVVILFFALTGVIPLWSFMIFLVLAIAVVVSEKTLSW